MKKKYRLLSLFMALVMLLVSINLTLTILAEGLADNEQKYSKGLTVRDDALHFIIRHWHTQFDPDAIYQADQDGGDEGFFVVVEGYIMPNDNPDEDNNFDIYVLDKNSGELIKVSDLVADADNKGGEFTENDGDGQLTTSPYFGKFSKKDGTIELKIKPVRNPNDKTDVKETFAGFSMSAGRGAVKYLPDSDGDGVPDGIKISYGKGETHLVKGHIFYNNWRETMPGSSDPLLFDPENYPEIDTAEAFTFAKNFIDKNGNAHTEGEIVKYIEDGVECLCITEEDLKKALKQLLDFGALTEEEIDALIDKKEKENENDTDFDKYSRYSYISETTTVFYSTTEGLHTNKVLLESPDGRMFLFDLQAWYIEGFAAQIGFLLDASGGMAFAKEMPTIINIYAVVAARLGITYKIEGDKYIYTYTTQFGNTINYTYTTTRADRLKEEYVIYQNGLKLFLEELEKDIGTSEYAVGKDELTSAISVKIGYEFTRDHWDFLFSKIDGINTQMNTEIDTFPMRDKLIGYYEIQNNSGTGTLSLYRTWLYNSILSEDGSNKYFSPADFASNRYKDITNESIKQSKTFASIVPHYENFSSTAGKSTGLLSPNEKDNSFSFSKEFWETHVTPGSKYGDAWGSFPMNFNNSVNTSTGSSYGINLHRSNAAFMPVQPSGNQFTLSFNLQARAVFNTDEKAQILYVGAVDGNVNNPTFFTVVREGKDLVFYQGYSENSSSEELARISNMFENDVINTITLSFDVEDGENNSKVSVYLNGKKQFDLKATISGNTVAISPFKNSWNTVALGNVQLYLDDIFVYDTALSSFNVDRLFSAYKNGKGIDDVITGWNNVFVNSSNVALAVLLNPNNTAHTPLGVAAYNYFIYDSNDNTREYAPLAYWEGKVNENGSATTNGGTVLATPGKYVKDVAGWFYLSHNRSISKDGTAKTLAGVGYGSGTDYVDLPSFGGELISDNGTGKIYENTEGYVTIRFYLDEEGNLRCFFSRKASTADYPDSGVSAKNPEIYQCSYVYEKTDDEYVKTEVLQRVLAKFATQISERSSTSLISATQFSNPDRTDKILLDWTNNSQEIAQIMSQTRGIGTELEGKAGAFDGSGRFVNGEEVKQYNYALTGNTNVESAIDVYYSGVLSTGFIADAPKFLIIFTDGVDDAVKTSKDSGYSDKNRVKIGPNDYIYIKDSVIDKTNALKEKGYTIVTVYLPCGPALANGTSREQMEQNDEYKKAQAFLSTISGNSKGDKFFFAAHEVNKLIEIFNNEIMSQITDFMTGYTITDYIDPRFDLKTNTDTIWHLNKDGNVKLDVVDGVKITGKTEFNVTEEDVKYPLSQSSASDPYLRYDKEKEMYYLEWYNQDIPTTPVGADSMLPVWNAKIWLKAKDDFIGGNAIITNGNEEYMNWVYHEYDLDKDVEKNVERINRARAKLVREVIENCNNFNELFTYDSYKNIIYNKYIDKLYNAYKDELSEIYASEIDEYFKKNYPKEPVLTDEILRKIIEIVAKEFFDEILRDEFEEAFENFANEVLDEFAQRYLYEAGYTDSYTDRMAEIYGEYDFIDFTTSEQEKVEKHYQTTKAYVKKNFKISTHEASSGTNDMKKEFEFNADGTRNFDAPIDEYVSKGFPRITVNVRLIAMNSQDLNGALYLGELISSAQLLTDIEDEYVTESYYLEYLKSYAYQRYLFCLERYKELENSQGADSEEILAEMQDLMNQMDMPLLELLNEWLDINDATVLDKSFSIPYMYLPRVKYDQRTGQIAKKGDGTAKTILNNTGTEAHANDVLGILTYRWVQINEDVVKDHVKTDLTTSKYALTVEFTPLREGDSFFEITDEEGVVITPSLNSYDSEYETNPDVQIFAEYIPIDFTKGRKIKWEDADFEFDRYVYVNERLITEREFIRNGNCKSCETGEACECEACIAEENGTSKHDCKCQWRTPYKWDAQYKPAFYDEQIKEGAENGDYGDSEKVEIINNYRTITISSNYTLDTVGGNIIFELRIKKTQLNDLLKKSPTGIYTEFTLNATRYFTDTEYAEKTKRELHLSDYGRAGVYFKVDDDTIINTGIYTFTFELNYSKEDIDKLEDESGYVKMFATVKSVKGKFINRSVEEVNGEQVVVETLNDQVELKDALPIGTYQFTLEDFKSSNSDDPITELVKKILPETSSSYFDKDHFGFSIGGDEDEEEKDNPEGIALFANDIEDSDKKEKTMYDYKANSSSKDDSVLTFYLGTNGNNERGDLSYVDGVRAYTNHRLAIIMTSTEQDNYTFLTIVEKGGKVNESFLYRISGTAIDGTPINIVVSVRGNSKTTIWVPMGYYTVQELSDWSWRYDVNKIEGTNAVWQIDLGSATAEATIFTQETVVLTYTHTSNDKPWLGSENFEKTVLTSQD